MELESFRTLSRVFLEGMPIEKVLFVHSESINLKIFRMYSLNTFIKDQTMSNNKTNKLHIFESKVKNEKVQLLSLQYFNICSDITFLLLFLNGSYFYTSLYC